MQDAVEGHRALAVADHLDPPCQGIPAEDDATDTGEVTRSDDRPVALELLELEALEPQILRHDHLGAGRHVQAGLDRDVVTHRNAEAGVGPQQAAVADVHPGGATARQRSHDGGAAADVAGTLDHHPCRDSSFDHAALQGAGVEVDETLVHDGCPYGQVGTQPYAGAVGDTHPRRDVVVRHGGELVHAHDGQRLAALQQLPANPLDVVGQEGAVARPGDVRQDAEHLHVGLVGPDGPPRQHLQAQTRVDGILWRGRVVQIGDPGQHGRIDAPEPGLAIGLAQHLDDAPDGVQIGMHLAIVLGEGEGTGGGHQVVEVQQAGVHVRVDHGGRQPVEQLGAAKVLLVQVHGPEPDVQELTVATVHREAQRPGLRFAVVGKGLDQPVDDGLELSQGLRLLHWFLFPCRSWHTDGARGTPVFIHPSLWTPEYP